MRKKTRDGLEAVVRLLEASSKLDPVQKKAALKAISMMLHALAVRDVRGVNDAVDRFARIFLRLTPEKTGRL